MSQKPSLLQSQFRHSCFGTERDIADHLDTQCLQLHQLEAAVQRNNADNLHERAAVLDFYLLRYACALLKSRLAEAARLDCAQLIADSVFDVSEDDTAAEQWSTWLATAPCWSNLAFDQWHHAISLASEIVVDRLKTAGVYLDRTVIDEIDKAVADLALKDLLPKTTYERFFPTNSDQTEAADDG